MTKTVGHGEQHRRVEAEPSMAAEHLDRFPLAARLLYASSPVDNAIALRIDRSGRNLKMIDQSGAELGQLGGKARCYPFPDRIERSAIASLKPEW